MSYNLYRDRYSKDSYLTEEILEFTNVDITSNHVHMLRIQPYWETNSFSITSSNVQHANLTHIGPDNITTGMIQVSNIMSEQSSIGIYTHIHIHESGNIHAERFLRIT